MTGMQLIMRGESPDVKVLYVSEDCGHGRWMGGEERRAVEAGQPVRCAFCDEPVPWLRVWVEK